MSVKVIPHADHGLASSAFDEYAGIELLASDLPAVMSASAQVGTLGTAGVAKWTPVRYDRATGLIELAVWDADPAKTVLPNALTSHTIAPGSAASDAAVVYVAGNFNPAAINWPASFDTAGKRNAAFDLASCQIHLTGHAFA